MILGFFFEKARKEHFATGKALKALEALVSNPDLPSETSDHLRE